MSDQQDRLAALLRENVRPQHAAPTFWGEFAARLIAAGVSAPPAKPRAEGLREALELVAGSVIEEYDKTHLTHDTAYEDVAAAIDQLRLVLRGRDHPGLAPQYRAALASRPTPAPLDVER
jgi:hypothetical protein